MVGESRRSCGGDQIYSAMLNREGTGTVSATISCRAEGIGTAPGASRDGLGTPAPTVAGLGIERFEPPLGVAPRR